MHVAGFEPGAQFTSTLKLALLVGAELNKDAPGFGAFIRARRANL
jgi:hypothetical protein